MATQSTLVGPCWSTPAVGDRLENGRSAAERTLLAQDLWDSVINDPDGWTLGESQRAELDRRLEAYRKGQDSDRNSSWGAVKARIRRAR
jgi:putative addiction module component (TIGR02574 family)